MSDVVWCMLYLVRVVLSARSYDCNPRVLTIGCAAYVHVCDGVVYGVFVYDD